MHASGSFDIQSTPHPPYDTAPGATLSRVTFAKQFHGDLEGTSVVEMLSAVTEVEGSAGYVAMERIAGTLQGRNGSFVVQHNGVMDRGATSLTISVVPDSGTDGLKGIAGTMDINIVDGKHFYTIDYRLADAQA